MIDENRLMNQSDIEKISQFDEKVNDYIKKGKQLIKEKIETYHTAQRLAGKNSQKIDGDVVYYVLKNLIPIVNVVSEESMRQGYKPKYKIYNTETKRWEHNLNFIGRFANKVYGNQLLSDMLLKNIETTIAYDDDIPLIRDQKPDVQIVNDQFNEILYFNEESYDMQTGERQQIKPSDLAFQQLSYDLAHDIDDDFKNECDELFLTFANGNEKRALTLKQIYLAALIHYNPGKKAINLYGGGGTGKSTYLNILKELVDRNHTTITYADLNRDDALARIQDRHLIIGTDNSDKAVINDSHIFKLLVGQDEFSYSVKFKDRETNRFKGLMIQAFNEAPQFSVKGANTQILDRMHTILFNNRLRETNDDIKNYSDEFKNKQKLSQLALYLLNEVEAFTEFSYSDNDLNETLFNENDTVYQFIQDMFELNEVKSQQVIPVAHLYQLYKNYVSDHNPAMKPMGQRKFLTKAENHLTNLGYEHSSERKLPKYLEKRGLYNQERIFNVMEADYLTPKESKSYYFINQDTKDEITQLINQALADRSAGQAFLRVKANDLKEAKENNDQEEIEKLSSQIKELLEDE